MDDVEFDDDNPFDDEFYEFLQDDELWDPDDEYWDIDYEILEDFP